VAISFLSTTRLILGVDYIQTFLQLRGYLLPSRGSVICHDEIVYVEDKGNYRGFMQDSNSNLPNTRQSWLFDCDFLVRYRNVLSSALFWFSSRIVYKLWSQDSSVGVRN